MRIKDFDELRKIKLEFDMESQRLNNLINTITLLGGNSDADRVDGGGINNTEDKYIALVDKLHNQQAVVTYISNKYYELEEKIYSKIKKVSEINWIYGFILNERFLMLTSPDKIAKKIHYCRRRYFELQCEAIKNYNKI